MSHQILPSTRDPPIFFLHNPYRICPDGHTSSAFLRRRSKLKRPRPRKIPHGGLNSNNRISIAQLGTKHKQHTGIIGSMAKLQGFFSPGGHITDWLGWHAATSRNSQISPKILRATNPKATPRTSNLILPNFSFPLDSVVKLHFIVPHRCTKKKEFTVRGCGKVQFHDF